MRDSLVLDGSAALAILLPDEKGAGQAKALRAMLDEVGILLAPGHWWAEVANGVLVAEKRHRLSQVESGEVLDVAGALGVVLDDESELRIPRDALALARQCKLTLYDAAYLELAIRHHAGLATLDTDLKRAAKSCGVITYP